MQLHENDIRLKCDYILDHVQQIIRLNKDRNIIFFLEEIRDKVIEIMYTSDEWFVGVQTLNDKNLQLIRKIEQVSKINIEYANELDHLE